MIHIEEFLEERLASTNHVEYKIVLRRGQFGWTVRRRYNDFVDAHAHLVSHLPVQRAEALSSPHRGGGVVHDEPGWHDLGKEVRTTTTPTTSGVPQHHQAGGGPPRRHASDSDADFFESAPLPADEQLRRNFSSEQLSPNSRESYAPYEKLLAGLPHLPPKEPFLQKLFGTVEKRQDFFFRRCSRLREFSSYVLRSPWLTDQPVVKQLFSIGHIPRPEPPEAVRIKHTADQPGKVAIKVQIDRTSSSNGMEPDLVLVEAVANDEVRKKSSAGESGEDPTSTPKRTGRFSSGTTTTSGTTSGKTPKSVKHVLLQIPLEMGGSSGRGGSDRLHQDAARALQSVESSYLSERRRQQDDWTWSSTDEDDRLVEWQVAVVASEVDLAAEFQSAAPSPSSPSSSSSPSASPSAPRTQRGPSPDYAVYAVLDLTPGVTYTVRVLTEIRLLDLRSAPILVTAYAPRISKEGAVEFRSGGAVEEDLTGEGGGHHDGENGDEAMAMTVSHEEVASDAEPELDSPPAELDEAEGPDLPAGLASIPDLDEEDRTPVPPSADASNDVDDAHHDEDPASQSHSVASSRSLSASRGDSKSDSGSFLPPDNADEDPDSRTSSKRTSLKLGERRNIRKSAIDRVNFRGNVAMDYVENVELKKRDAIAKNPYRFTEQGFVKVEEGGDEDARDGGSTRTSARQSLVTGEDDCNGVNLIADVDARSASASNSSSTTCAAATKLTADQRRQIEAIQQQEADAETIACWVHALTGRQIFLDDHLTVALLKASDTLLDLLIVLIPRIKPELPTRGRKIHRFDPARIEEIFETGEEGQDQARVKHNILQNVTLFLEVLEEKFGLTKKELFSPADVVKLAQIFMEATRENSTKKFDKQFEARFRTMLRCFFALAKNFDRMLLLEGLGEESAAATRAAWSKDGGIAPPGYYRISAERRRESLRSQRGSASSVPLSSPLSSPEPTEGLAEAE